MWHFNGEDDATRYGRKGPDTYAPLAKILSGLYKGEEEEFIHIKPRDGFPMYNPPSWVSYRLTTLLHQLPESFFMNINPSFITGMSESHQGDPHPRTTDRGPQPDP